LPTCLKDGIEAAPAPEDWLRELKEAVGGPAHVLSSLPDRIAYARDRAPYSTFRFRDGTLPGTLPLAIVRPGSEAEVQAVVRWARQRKVALVPYGAGSGVLGGAVPLHGELVVDTKRLSGIVGLDEIDGTATVEAGTNGGAFEEELNARGFTAGHLPQSLHMSTVGGWAACRGAGQVSARYGKIEDIVIGLRAVLPDGAVLDVLPAARRAVGPSLKDLLIGSEGTLGIITRLTLRVWRLPDHTEPVVIAFPTLPAAFGALRGLLQDEVRPLMTRLYDATESAHRVGAEPLPPTHPYLCILAFSGPRRLAEAERDVALEHITAAGGARLGDAAYEAWKSVRYQSYSPQHQAAGRYMDTIEVTAPWRALDTLYDDVAAAVRAVHPEVYFAAHWSHTYPEGACQYMTLRLPPMPSEQGYRLHEALWDTVQRLCLERGVSISHHHGSGFLRNPWLEKELNAGMDLLRALKRAIDPDNLLNPGKLAM